MTEAEACPIGYEADSYLLYDELMGLPREQRGVALLDSIVIRPEDEARISALLPHKTPEALELGRAPADLAAECRGRAVADFARTGHGLRCTVRAEKDGVWYFTVPFDRGWTALVDGEEAAVLNSGCMLAVPVAAGEHTLELRYRSPGFYAGGTISLVSLLLCAGLYGFLRRKKR